MRSYRPNQKSGIGKVLAATIIGTTAGYFGNEFHKPRDGFTINDGIIQKQGYQPRTITTEEGVIQVGSTKERINDLLYENPHVIKRTVEELYATYANETENK